MKVTRKQGKIEDLRIAIAEIDGAQSRVGWFPGAVYEGGQPVAGIAAVQEFGNAIIPPRPFFRTTVIAKSDEWRNTVKQLAAAAMRGNIQPDHVMDALALAAEGHVRQAIIDVQSPPLKPGTIYARKRRLADGGKGASASIGKPLVDTGIMLATLTSEVTKK